MPVKLDEDGGKALIRVSRELVRGTPGNFMEIHCDVRVTPSEAGRRVGYRITCPQFPEAGSLQPKEPLHRAVLDLLDNLERAGTPVVGLRVVCIVGADKKVTTSIDFLEPPAPPTRDEPAAAPDPVP
jgi:hypothetical protein